MEKKAKNAVIAGAAAVLLVAGFLGASAWRYFTVVLPENQAEEQASRNEGEAAESEQQQNEGQENPAAGKNESGDSVSYSGDEESVWSILSGFSWTTAGGASYLSFSDDGTCRLAAKGSTSAPSEEFEILSVEGEPDSAQGCTVIVRQGNSYATMSFLSREAAGEEPFADMPDSDYRISCNLFNDGAPFYKDPSNEVYISYPSELPSFLAQDKALLDEAVSATVKAELPAVSSVSWNPYASFFYDEGGNGCYMTTYECDDAPNTSVTAMLYPDSGKTVVETSGAVASTTAHTDAAGGEQ